ncbi:MAG: HAD hydrolase-like protein [Candidatus Omnitrophica bacterium]|nr:HAD hydrolase-like protein [Candidatus Omnitrophota bacterium]
MRSAHFYSLASRLIDTRKPVVGMDLFDTVLCRRVPGEYIHELSAKNLFLELKRRGFAVSYAFVLACRRNCERTLYARAQEQGYDPEIRFSDLVPLWVASCCGKKVSDPGLCLYIHDSELALEKDALMPAPYLKDTLGLLRRYGRRIIFISDMYHSTDTLWQFIDALGVRSFFDAGYSSSDMLQTKSSGRLFRHVLEIEKIIPDDLVFAGDNIESDYRAAHRLGIQAVYVSDPYESARRVSVEVARDLTIKNQYWSGYFFKRALTSTATSDYLRPPSGIEDRLIEIAGPLFILFILKLHERARELGIRKIYFVSRAGRVLQQMFHVLFPHTGPDAIETRYLYASRRSTLLASLDSLDSPEAYDSLAVCYWRTVRQLAHALQLDLGLCASSACACGIASIDEILESRLADKRLQQFLARPDVAQDFSKKRNGQRDLLLRYLIEEGLSSDKPVAFVDLGWHGSIQENIVRLLQRAGEKPQIHGFYFGLMKSQQQSSVAKEGFVNDTEFFQWPLCDMRALFEFCLQAEHGCVMRYQKVNDALGHVEPVFEQDELEQRVYQSVGRRLHMRLLAYASKWKKCMPLFPFRTHELARYFLDQAYRYIVFPSTQDIKEFTKFQHKENLLGTTIPIHTFSLLALTKALRGNPLQAVRRLRQHIRSQSAIWPQAYFRSTNIPGILFVLEIVRFLRFLARNRQARMR